MNLIAYSLQRFADGITDCPFVVNDQNISVFTIACHASLPAFVSKEFGFILP